MLIIKNLHKTFAAGTVNEKCVFGGSNEPGLHFHLEAGDFCTIIGGNGAGKSTLLNMIAGVFPADTGSIILDGKEIIHLPEHRRASLLGRVFQDPMKGTAAGMEIEENLALAYRRGKRRGLAPMLRADEREIYKRELSALGLGLEKRLSMKVGLLSGGQRQAVTLLMATLKKPKLLLLDEHTAALDPKTARTVLETTRHIVSRDNLTALMVTHNMKDAISIGNRLIMMHEGSIIYDVRGEEKSALSVKDLLKKFEEASGTELANDRMIFG